MRKLIEYLLTNLTFNYKNMQVKNSFDKTTLIKIAKGAAIAATGSAALYLLDWLTKIDLGVWTPTVALIVPTLVNTIREYMKGE